MGERYQRVLQCVNLLVLSSSNFSSLIQVKKVQLEIPSERVNEQMCNETCLETSLDNYVVMSNSVINFNDPLKKSDIFFTDLNIRLGK